MPRLIAILFVAGLFAGCATDGSFIKDDAPNTCGTTGWTLTTIFYGDSHIVVVPMSEIVKDTELRFLLAPVNESTDIRNFADVTVKVKGKPPHDTWFAEEEGKANLGGGTIRVCVDGTTLVAGDEIFYVVEVEDVGVLDPRARVIVRPD